MDNVEAFVRRFVILPAAAYLTLAIWIIATHAADLFDCFPYVALLSPAKRCGKTRVLEVMQLLVARGWLTTSPTPPVLFRKLATMLTLLLDEVEVLNVNNKSESSQGIIAVLNSGYRKGSCVERCEPPNQSPRSFPVFGPKCFAAIGRLPETILDRSFIIAMQRRGKNQTVGRFLQSRAAAEAKPMRQAAAALAKNYQAEIAAAYASVLDGHDLDFLSDRDAEIWASMFAVCAIAAPKRAKELKACAIALSAAKSVEDEDETLSLKLLADIRETWPAGQEFCTTKSIIERLLALEESPWAKDGLSSHKVANSLRPYGVRPCQPHVEPKNLRGYRLSDLEIVFARYLTDLIVTSVTETHKPLQN